MRTAFLIATMLLALAGRTVGSAKHNKAASLELILEVVSQESCQFTPIVQGVTIHGRLQFLNSTKDELAVQEIGHLYLIAMAKTEKDMARGVYEVNSQFESPPIKLTKKSHPFTIKSGDKFEITETFGISVVREKQMSAPAGDDAVQPGKHYLQIGKVVMLGDSNPDTWRNLSVRSVPVPIDIEYSDKVLEACQPKGTD
jgi:hypothetical protein